MLAAQPIRATIMPPVAQGVYYHCGMTGMRLLCTILPVRIGCECSLSALVLFGFHIRLYVVVLCIVIVTHDRPLLTPRSE